MESQEKLQTAENVAAWFAGEDAPQTSSHYLVDADSIIQCVKEKDVAWHAAGANHASVGVELAGKAEQTREQWLDDYSVRVLELAAGLVADICQRNRIPVRLVDSMGLQGNLGGITTHAQVSKAFGKTDHWDPGPGWPMDVFLEMVRKKSPVPDVSL